MPEDTKPLVNIAAELAAKQKVEADVRQKAITDAKAAAARAKADAEARARVELKAKHDSLRTNIGKKFSDGDRTGTVTGFEPYHVVRGKWGETFLVNFGNPNRNDYFNAEDFLVTFKPKE